MHITPHTHTHTHTHTARTGKGVADEPPARLADGALVRVCLAGPHGVARGAWQPHLAGAGGSEDATCAGAGKEEDMVEEKRLEGEGREHKALRGDEDGTREEGEEGRSEEEGKAHTSLCAPHAIEPWRPSTTMHAT